MYEIEVANRQDRHAFSPDRLESIARDVLGGEGVRQATVSIAIVDDATIHELNRRFLDHDHATDVLSFPLEFDGERLDGEVILSAETAARQAVEFGWSTTDEMALYVVHGVLHLTGYRDDSDELAEKMRRREEHYLGRRGLVPRYG